LYIYYSGGSGANRPREHVGVLRKLEIEKFYIALSLLITAEIVCEYIGNKLHLRVEKINEKL